MYKELLKAVWCGDRNIMKYIDAAEKAKTAVQQRAEIAEAESV